MKTVYKMTEHGWKKVKICQSFKHACDEATRLQEETGIPHCVNK